MPARRSASLRTIDGAALPCQRHVPRTVLRDDRAEAVLSETRPVGGLPAHRGNEHTDPDCTAPRRVADVVPADGLDTRAPRYRLSVVAAEAAARAGRRAVPGVGMARGTPGVALLPGRRMASDELGGGRGAAQPGGRGACVGPAGG